ncbi:hypothetical protein [Streptomyces virginiae]|uniref:hypothetical protein n=1 Tax=Streptomyces virginiae TaxID=1961 RepID=UPI00225501CB|nr:hypothetical protein [Streptomyces virginiae]MCX5278024.1 hypothetical protein [Streptomyces virginiae]
MSCHTLTPREDAPPGRTVLIGWDQLGTYYASVTDREGEAVRDVLFAGADRYDISEVATVIELVAAYAPIPAGLKKILIGDRASEGYRCPTCLGRGARVLPASCDETECSPCEGTGKVQCAHGLTLASGECTTCTFEAESPAAAEAARAFDERCAAQHALLHYV